MLEPENELGVIVLFTQQCEEAGFEILSIQSAFPDALIRRGDIEYRAEFEFRSSSFYHHKHDPRKTDLVICWQHDRDCILPVLALSEDGWQQKEIVLPSQSEREIDYWKHRAMRAERRVKQSQGKKDIQNNTEKQFCPYCNAEFATVQALSAHLRWCAAYQSQKELQCQT